MRTLGERLLPRTVDHSYHGHRAAWIVFAALSLVSMGRSLVHIFAADGGAGTIAGIDLATGGSASVIFAFGLWGLSQAVYAVIQILVAFRYRALVPLMYLLLIVETGGRILIGLTKPPVLLHTPPGGVANYVILPLALVMLVLSLGQTPSTRAER